MPFPYQVRDDASGIQNMPASMDSGFRQNEMPRANAPFLQGRQFKGHQGFFKREDAARSPPPGADRRGGSA